jgi:hypothetical protein
MPPVQAQQAQLRQQLNPATATARIEPSFTYGQPAGPAYANANPNAAFQRPAAAGGVTAADMVDVPGFGPMPRSLLGSLQQRLQARAPQPQGGPANQPVIDPNFGMNPQTGRDDAQDRINVLIGNGDRAGAQRLFDEVVSRRGGRDAMRQHQMEQQRQQPAPQPGYGPAVGTRPVDTRYRPETGAVPFRGTPYGNDNVGVGVPQPAPVAAPAPPPPPAVAAAPSPTPTTPEPGAPGNHWWNAQTGQWVAIDRAAEAGARNAAMVPPAPPVSPIAGHLWGGGPEAFGAGRSPVATSMTDFYGAFGSGIPGQPVPTQQQLYDRFNANPQNPYQISGAVNNGNTVFPGPSWY